MRWTCILCTACFARWQQLVRHHQLLKICSTKPTSQSSGDLAATKLDSNDALKNTLSPKPNLSSCFTCQVTACCAHSKCNNLAMLGLVRIATRICHLVLTLHAHRLTLTQHAVLMLQQKCTCKKDTACQWEMGQLTLPVLAKPCNRVISKKAMMGNMMAVNALMGSQYSCTTFTSLSVSYQNSRLAKAWNLLPPHPHAQGMMLCLKLTQQHRADFLSSTEHYCLYWARSYAWLQCLVAVESVGQP